MLSFSDEINLSEEEGADLAADVNAAGEKQTLNVSAAEKAQTSALNVAGDEQTADLNSREEEPTAEVIVVYLCGAVKNPGVYTLKSGSRINDALEAAGGFTFDASEASVNLAAKLADADMIYIPTVEETEREESLGEAGSPDRGQASTDSLVNINTADMYELCGLPGIGESKARDIITYREKNGAFQKKEDIMKVSGIKMSLYEKICDLISVK